MSPITIPYIMWINHMALQLSDTTLKTQVNYGQYNDSFVIQSTTTGDRGINNIPKRAFVPLQIPPGYYIMGVRLCYELSNSRSYISSIYLDQQKPTVPITFSGVLIDNTPLKNTGPSFVDSKACKVDAFAGKVCLSLFLFFGNTADIIRIRAIGLLLQPV